MTAWWAPLVIVAAALSADLVSGLVHWTADTWRSETMPVFGRRFLRPFRVQHVNPDDFLCRDVIDCNGDVAMLKTIQGNIRGGVQVTDRRFSDAPARPPCHSAKAVVTVLSSPAPDF